MNGILFDSPPDNFDEWLDTFESNFSHLSPWTKEKTKLEKLIKKSFDIYGKAPEITAKFYRIGKILGKGAFGKVILAIHRLS